MTTRRRTRGRPPRSRSLDLAREPFLIALREACRLANNASASSAQTDADRQTEDIIFRAAVALEAFLTEWMVRCLSFDTSRLRRHVERELQETAANAVRGRRTPETVIGRTLEQQAPSIQVDLPIADAVSLPTARQLLGVSDSNRSFSSAAEFKEWAGRYLADARARAANELTPEHDAIIDATIALRNVLAHRSAQAQRRLNQVLRSGALPGDLRIARNISARGVGGYLRVIRAGRSRYELIFTQLSEIAYILAKTRGRRLRVCT